MAADDDLTKLKREAAQNKHEDEDEQTANLKVNCNVLLQSCCFSFDNSF